MSRGRPKAKKLILAARGRIAVELDCSLALDVCGVDAASTHRVAVLRAAVTVRAASRSRRRVTTTHSLNLQRIEGLHDELRPGPPRTINDERVAELINKTLHTKPADGSAH